VLQSPIRRSPLFAVAALALCPTLTVASPLFDLTGDTLGQGGLQARLLPSSGTAAYFNPALLVDSPAETAHTAIERLRRAIESARVHSIRGDVRVTASFGLAIVDPQVCDLEQAVRLADEALYEAKSAGRNCIRIRAVNE